jgi:hypothetical protein
MKIRMVAFVGMIILIVGLNIGCQQTLQAKSCRQWIPHDPNRPQPAVVAPGLQVGQPPSDAVILFDGRDLSAWERADGRGSAPWKVENGYMEVVPNAKDIHTRQSFGDFQLHIEWAVPELTGKVRPKRGNSGIYLMDNYEIQVFDSFHNTTYPDGCAGAVYGQSPPMVNTCRPPEQWQNYDIVFHGPRFDKSGKLLCPACVSVWQNGVIIQDNFTIKGLTDLNNPVYKPHRERMPLRLQEHGDPVRYRNIWIRELN